MTMTTAILDRRLTNPVYWLMWLLPGSAVVASFVTLFIALESGDRALPESYHWEGARLDADFARARAAATLGIEIEFDSRDGQCRALVRKVPRDPPAVSLLLTNGADAGLDRRLRLVRVAPEEYRAGCAPIAAGTWRVSVDDDSGAWNVRGVASGNLASLALRARNPDGSAP
jgi:uncharacterized protein